MTRWAAAAAFALCCALVAARMHRDSSVAAWSDPRTWGTALPGRGAVVRIARNQTVLLDTQPPRLSKLIVDGRLIFADRDLRLEAGEIAVTGSLEAGTERAPFGHRAQIVLDGASAGSGMLGVASGGRLELWGTPRLAWLRLARGAHPGDRQLLLAAAPDWKPGDRIAIAPSGYDARETEERGITAIEGPRVYLDRPLRHRHWGTVTAGADERAEVALLTHNVSITSDAQAIRSGIGGHLVVGRGGTLRASNVAFAGLGQRGKLGRYPLHFHLAGDARGSLLQASSITHSNNRCLTIHGSNGITVRDNVAYDTIGHCYFLEDGIETGNRFERNLGMLTRAAPPKTAILESDVLPATYWISNPDNLLLGNVAAGSEGNGFWFNLSPHPTGPSATDAVWPRRTRLAGFSRNVSHSNEMNGLFVDILRNPRGVSEAPNYDPPAIADFNALTSYKNRRRGAWLRGTKLRLTHATLADNSIGLTFAGADDVLEDALVIGETENRAGPPKPFEPSFPIRGFEFYDGQVGVSHTRFANFVSNANRRASALGALQYSPFFTDPSSFAQAIAFDNAEPVYLAKHAGARDRLGADGYRGTVFVDADGSVTGMPKASVVLDTPILRDRDCVHRVRWNAWVCKAGFASLFIIAVDARGRSPGPVKVARADRTGFLTLYGNPTAGKDSIFQTNVRHERAYVVTFAKSFPRHLKLGLHNLPEGHALRLLFPQAPADTSVYERRSLFQDPGRRPRGGPLAVDVAGNARQKVVLDLCGAMGCG